MALDRVGSRMTCTTVGRGSRVCCALVAFMFLAALAAFAAPSLAAGPTAAEILERMSAAHASAGSMWLKMQVSVMDPEVGQSFGFLASVSVDMQSELLRLEILDTDIPMIKGQIVVVDSKEKAVYVYMPMLNQVVIQPMTDAANGGAGGVAGGVAGLGDMVPPVPGIGPDAGDNVDINRLADGSRVLGTATFQGRSCYVVEVKSDRTSQDGQKVAVTSRFWVAADDYMLLKFETLGKSGIPSVSTVILEYKFNLGFTRAKLLEFPKGASVIDKRKKR